MKFSPLFCRVLFFLCVVVFLSSANAQGKKSLTVEWIYSDESTAVAELPSFRWLSNSTAVLYDTRKPAHERTLELFDPATGRRTAMVEAATALRSLDDVAGETNTPSILPFPEEIEGSGRRALYLFENDIFLLDIRRATFLRVTDTPAEEKSVNFSPDGKKLAFVRENDLYVYDIENQKEMRLTADGSEAILNGTLTWVYWEEVFGRRDIGYWWSEDSRALAYLRTDHSMVSLQTYVDFMPWTPRVITQRYPKVGEPNPRVRVGIIELASSVTTWVDFGSHAYEYIVRVQWTSDAKRLSVQTMNRDQNELDLFFVDRATGKAKSILNESNKTWVNIHDDLYFLKDGKHFLWSSERDGYEHLYRYTMDGKLVNQITKGSWPIRSSGGAVFWLRQAVAGIDEDGSWIYFTALEKSSVERHLYRIRMDGTRMTRLSKEDGTHAPAFSPNAKYYFNKYSTLSTLPSLTLHTNDGTRALLLAGPRPERLADFGLQYSSLFTIPARDGFQLPAKLLKPKDFNTTKRYPLILYVYGGPSAPQVSNAWQNSIYFDNILLENGYLVLVVDPRHSTAISKKLEDLIFKRTGVVELSDLVDAVRWMKAQPYIDSTRVGLWGWSGGGTYTLLGMTRSQEFKAGIAVAGVTDFRFYDTKWAEAFMQTEATNKDGYESESLLSFAKDLHGRLMIVHGTYDDNVHVQNTWAFVDELVKANKMFDMMIYPMRMHGISDRPARIHLYNTMLEFWKKNL
ncbi:MAG: S9 family peptidase [Bacteroidota bacterium]